MATGWVKDGSTWYYLNASNGDMKTGWTKVNGTGIISIPLEQWLQPNYRW